jgi:hypothetical protein
MAKEAAMESVYSYAITALLAACVIWYSCKTYYHSRMAKLELRSESGFARELAVRDAQVQKLQKEIYQLNQQAGRSNHTCPSCGRHRPTSG